MPAGLVSNRGLRGRQFDVDLVLDGLSWSIEERL